MKNLKKYSLVTLAIFICLSFTSNMVLASEAEVKDMGSKNITDTNKVWTIMFKSEIDISSLSSNVQIKDLTAGSTFTPTLSQGSNDYSVKVAAPSGGYTEGHKYQLILSKGIKSKKGKVLPKTTVLTFNVEGKSSGGDTTSYDASANVVLAPAIPAFKQIKITSTTLPSGTKFKIEGNNNMFSLGADIATLAGNTANIYFYSSDGTTEIGTGVLDLSATNSSVSIKITN